MATAGMVLRSLGVACALVKVGGGEDLTVEPCGEIGITVEQGDVMGGNAESRDRDEAHQDPVSGKRSDCERRFAAPTGADEIERGHDEIADGDTGEHSIKAHGMQMKVGKAVSRPGREDRG